MAMCDKRNQLITQAVLDKLGSGTGIYTSDDILTAANIKEENLKELLGGILLQLYKFIEQKIKIIFYNVNFLIISNFIPFKMCKK